jgi:hypothetical protein
MFEDSVKKAKGEVSLLLGTLQGNFECCKSQVTEVLHIDQEANPDLKFLTVEELDEIKISIDQKINQLIEQARLIEQLSTFLKNM